jgi:hypothetical protein
VQTFFVLPIDYRFALCKQLGMERIACSHGCFALVDDEDFERLSQFRWNSKLHNADRGDKAHRRPIRNERGKHIYLYHDILPKKAGFVIDHINGDPWDNRRCNLRYATRSQNICNQQGHRGRARPFKGICKKRLRWFASITVNGKKFWSRGYSTPEEAARTYDEMALRHHGEFACLNFRSVA